MNIVAKCVNDEMYIAGWVIYTATGLNRIISPGTSSSLSLPVAVSGFACSVVLRSASCRWSLSRFLRYTTCLFVVTRCSLVRPSFAPYPEAPCGALCLTWRLTARVLARRLSTWDCAIVVHSGGCWATVLALVAAAAAALARCFLDGMAGLLLCFDAYRLTRANVGKKTSCAKKKNARKKKIYMTGLHK